jgi:hypothetical protein
MCLSSLNQAIAQHWWALATLEQQVQVQVSLLLPVPQSILSSYVGNGGLHVSKLRRQCSVST